MDLTNFSPTRRKGKLATITDAGNREELSPRVILKNCIENGEEMKENVSNTPPTRTRRSSARTPCNYSSLRRNGGSKPASRPGRQTPKRDYSQYFFSSDEDEGKKGVIRKTEDHRGVLRRSCRKSTGKQNCREVSSAEEDSLLELEGPETKSASKVGVEERGIPSNHESPPKSPKRKKDESDSNASPVPKRRTRKSTNRVPPSDDETTDTQDAVTPQKTSRSKTTHRFSKRMGTGGTPSLTSPDKDDSRGVENDAPDCDPTSLATTTPKSAKIRPQLRSRKSVSTQLESFKTKETIEEDSDVLSRGSSRPTTSVARRSSRVTSNDEHSDFLPRGCWEKLPKSNQTPKSRRSKTPYARNLEDDAEELREAGGEGTPKKTPNRRGKTPKKKSPAKIPRNVRPKMPERTNSIADSGLALDVVRANLHVSAVPDSLPCRETEFKDIYGFVGRKISDSAGGCMYISGMPGTGKTATVHAVVRHLEQDVAEGRLPPFQYIEVNGLRLTEPRQVFVRILQQLTQEKCTPQQAQEILAKKFTSGRGFNKAVLLLVDEVDMLRNRRQDVVYNLFDWPSKAHSRLIVLTIANTMDLPERLLMGRVTSRLGLTRLTFQPYNYKQLQEIVTARLQGSECFSTDAVQLVARKVAAVSGDARRALDICRRATELLDSDNERVSMAVVNNALMQMMNSASIKTLKACSRMEQLFLQAVVAETKRTGVEETNFNSVYRQFKEICNLDGIRAPNVSQSLGIVNRLGSSRILLTEHGKADIMQTIYLNVNSDDIHYAMTKPNAA